MLVTTPNAPEVMLCPSLAHLTRAALPAVLPVVELLAQGHQLTARALGGNQTSVAWGWSCS